MTVTVFEAPGEPNIGPELRSHKTLFLAGGITGCPDWQAIVIKFLADGAADLVAFNPRRTDFPMGDPNAAKEQITWEHMCLRAADGILFWFPAETLCPIVLYELGAWSKTDKPIFVGVHPNYERRQDVKIQTELERPEVTVLDGLPSLLDQVEDWALRA